MMVEDLLQRHLTMQLGVQGHEDGTETAVGVGAEHAESLSVAGRGADGVVGRAVSVAVLRRAVGRSNMPERRLEVRVDSRGEALARRAVQLQGGQAMLDIATVASEVGRG
jgi:hypothetical protein